MTPRRALALSLPLPLALPLALALPLSLPLSLPLAGLRFDLAGLALASACCPLLGGADPAARRSRRALGGAGRLVRRHVACGLSLRRGRL
ncbi:MAG: hypothetical protein ACKVWR_09710, partial [Acidimicrobiales bacterium]